MAKEISKASKRFRIALRFVAAVCFATPIVAYLTFAFMFEKITYIYNYDTLEKLVVHDDAYLVSASALSIGNSTWPILMPLGLALGAIDVGISLYRQISSS